MSVNQRLEDSIKVDSGWSEDWYLELDDLKCIFSLIEAAKRVHEADGYDEFWLEAGVGDPFGVTGQELVNELDAALKAVTEGG